MPQRLLRCETFLTDFSRDFMCGVGSIAKCNIPCAGARQHVDNDIYPEAEDPRETATDSRLLIQTQISLHY